MYLKEHRFAVMFAHALLLDLSKEVTGDYDFLTEIQ